MRETQIRINFFKHNKDIYRVYKIKKFLWTKYSYAEHICVCRRNKMSNTYIHCFINIYRKIDTKVQ